MKILRAVLCLATAIMTLPTFAADYGWTYEAVQIEDHAWSIGNLNYTVAGDSYVVFFRDEDKLIIRQKLCTNLGYTTARSIVSDTASGRGNWIVYSKEGKIINIRKGQYYPSVYDNYSYIVQLICER